MSIRAARPQRLDRPIKMRTPPAERRANSSCLKSRSRGAYNRSVSGYRSGLRLSTTGAEATPLLPDARFPRPCPTSPLVGSGPIQPVHSAGCVRRRTFVVSGNDPLQGGASGRHRLPGRIWCGLPRRPLSFGDRRQRSVYTCDGSTPDLIDDTDLPAVTGRGFYRRRFVFGLQNSSRFGWSDTSSATTVDGLAFPMPKARLFLSIPGWPYRPRATGHLRLNKRRVLGTRRATTTSLPQYAGAGPTFADASRDAIAGGPTTASLDGMTASSPRAKRSRTGEQSRHRGGAEICTGSVVSHGV